MRVYPDNLLAKLQPCAWRLSRDEREELGFLLPITVYVQDPLVAEQNPDIGLQDILVEWSSDIDDGPTSSRLTVFDYNGDTGMVFPPAKWDSAQHRFTTQNGDSISHNAQAPDSYTFHQVNVWAIVSRVLEDYESTWALGRKFPWGFEGQRLIIVPHAGWGENAYYDRVSKSLQFYYYGTQQNPHYTCLSHDIIAHETGHAVLDGIRPHLRDTSVQTMAVHEFVADMTAILGALRNNDVRHAVEAAVDEAGDLSGDQVIGHLAEEFGHYVADREYLRTAHNTMLMSDIAGNSSPHYCSQVLTGAVFEIANRINRKYFTERSVTALQALWYTFTCLQRTALQPLDLLPPCDVQFSDYALAVLRNQQYVDPVDQRGYIDVILDVFKRRGILNDSAGDEPRFPELRFPYSVDSLFRSRTEIYRFLHDNRKALKIPSDEDSMTVEIYDSFKSTRSGTQMRRLPRTVVLQYMWEEDIKLEGPEFGQFEGQYIALPCGGTLVFDERHNLLSWMRKEGLRVDEDREAGEARRANLLAHIAARIQRRQVALYDDADRDSIQLHTPPVIARSEGGLLRFEATPHLRNDSHEEEVTWTPSF